MGVAGVPGGGVLVSQCKYRCADLMREVSAVWLWECIITGHNKAPQRECIRAQGHLREGPSEKEIVMKRTINFLALFIASLFITAGVWAQSVKATIPFNWTVNGTYVP